jgi:hypothetical protein
VDDRVRPLVAELGAVADAWEEAWKAAEAARRHGDVVVARATVAVEVALAGMSLQRWRRLVNGEVLIRSPADGRDVNVARKRRPDVQLRLTQLGALRTVEAEKVEAAEKDLAGATRRLLVYGLLAEQVTGRSTSDLRRMARRSGDPRSA